MKYRGIFFDFDYTLGDATEAIVAGFLYGLHTMGYPIPTRAQIQATIGLVLKDGFTQLTGVTDEAQREEFAQLYRLVSTPCQVATARLCDGARELLESLHARGVRLALVSSKPTPILSQILAAQGVAPLIDLVVGADKVVVPKPDPQGVLQAAAALELAPGELLYCGDTTIDAKTGRNARVDFCAVLNGTTPGEAFLAYPCVHIAPDLRELKTWLEEETA